MAFQDYMNGSLPQGWAPEVLAGQSGYGLGTSNRYGPKPPTPDEVAARGTPEWRQAFNNQRNWMQNQFFAGATLRDMGFAPEKEHGLHAYTALMQGDFAGYRPDWAKASAFSNRTQYDPVGGQAIRQSGPWNPWGLQKGAGQGTPTPGFQNPAAQPMTEPTNSLIPQKRRRSLGDLMGYGG